MSKQAYNHALEYVLEVLQGFVNDPPDSDHQEGYLSAVIVIYEEALEGSGMNPIYLQAKKIDDRRS